MTESGSFLHVAQHAHVCSRPEIVTFGPAPEGREVPTVSSLAPGTVWECQCGRVWVVEWVRAHRRGNLWMAGGSEWRPERRGERRRRLGLGWWQKERP